MFNRLTLSLIVTVLALSLGLWYSISANGTLRAERDTARKALQSLQEQRKRDEALLTRTRAEKRFTGLQSERARQAVSEAAGAAPAWAGAVVPPEVQEALLGAVEGLQ